MKQVVDCVKHNQIRGDSVLVYLHGHKNCKLYFKKSLADKRNGNKNHLSYNSFLSFFV